MIRGAGGSPGEGPYIVLHLEVIEGVVTDGSFESNGCPAAHFAACAVLGLVKGRALAKMAQLEPKDLELLSGPLPDGKGFYYQLAVDALAACIQASIVDGDPA